MKSTMSVPIGVLSVFRRFTAPESATTRRAGRRFPPPLKSERIALQASGEEHRQTLADFAALAGPTRFAILLG